MKPKIHVRAWLFPSLLPCCRLRWKALSVSVRVWVLQPKSLSPPHPARANKSTFHWFKSHLGSLSTLFILNHLFHFIPPFLQEAEPGHHGHNYPITSTQQVLWGRTGWGKTAFSPCHNKGNEHPGQRVEKAHTPLPPHRRKTSPLILHHSLPNARLRLLLLTMVCNRCDLSKRQWRPRCRRASLSLWWLRGWAG